MEAIDVKRWYQIQRVWRGYLTRAEFWTDGGVGLHAVATRIQRVFRGWRGKVSWAGSAKMEFDTSGGTYRMH